MKNENTWGNVLVVAALFVSGYALGHFTNVEVGGVAKNSGTIITLYIGIITALFLLLNFKITTIVLTSVTESNKVIIGLGIIALTVGIFLGI